MQVLNLKLLVKLGSVFRVKLKTQVWFWVVFENLSRVLIEIHLPEFYLKLSCLFIIFWVLIKMSMFNHKFLSFFEF